MGSGVVIHICDGTRDSWTVVETIELPAGSPIPPVGSLVQRVQSEELYRGRGVWDRTTNAGITYTIKDQKWAFSQYTEERAEDCDEACPTSFTELIIVDLYCERVQ